MRNIISEPLFNMMIIRKEGMSRPFLVNKLSIELEKWLKSLYSFGIFRDYLIVVVICALPGNTRRCTCT